MLAKIFILICALAAVLAMPQPQDKSKKDPPPPYQSPVQLHGEGGGNRKDGFDIGVVARVPIYKSDNGNHEIGASAGLAQHLGGPYGNSKLDKIGGLDYTYRFKNFG